MLRSRAMNEYRTFDEFWPYYVREHAQPATRALHFVGTAGALACVAAFVATRKARWLAAALVAGYGPAWIGHFFIEGNRPATFRYPLWSLRADLKMFGLMLQGRMNDEVDRVMADEKTPPTPARPTKSGDGHDEGDDRGDSHAGSTNLN